jgi:hypothetical protein
MSQTPSAESADATFPLRDLAKAMALRPEAAPPKAQAFARIAQTGKTPRVTVRFSSDFLPLFATVVLAPVAAFAMPSTALGYVASFALARGGVAVAMAAGGAARQLRRDPKPFWAHVGPVAVTQARRESFAVAADALRTGGIVIGVSALALRMVGKVPGLKIVDKGAAFVARGFVSMVDAASGLTLKKESVENAQAAESGPQAAWLLAFRSLREDANPMRAADIFRGRPFDPRWAMDEHGATFDVALERGIEDASKLKSPLSPQLAQEIRCVAALARGLREAIEMELLLSAGAPKLANETAPDAHPASIAVADLGARPRKQPGRL